MIRIGSVLIMILFSTTLMAKSIVVLGDSLSAGYGMVAEKGWVSLLQHKLAKKNKIYKLYNESISGDTSAGGLARIDNVLARYSPELLILELGANDGLRGLSPQLIKRNLTEIIKRSKKRGTRVLLLSMRIPPNYGKRYETMFYNIYPQIAKELNVHFVPFILEDLALVKKLMQKDGLHPNSQAQPAIADKVWHYLQPYLEL